eukprot:357218-Chlamydomonas_euryale.AAC.29
MIRDSPLGGHSLGLSSDWRCAMERCTCPAGQPQRSYLVLQGGGVRGRRDAARYMNAIRQPPVPARAPRQSTSTPHGSSRQSPAPTHARLGSRAGLRRRPGP